MPRLVTWPALVSIASMLVGIVIWTWVFRGDIDRMISDRIDALRLELRAK